MAKLDPSIPEEKLALELAGDFIIGERQEMEVEIQRLKAQKKALGFGNRRKYAREHGMTVDEVKQLEFETARELRVAEANQKSILPKLDQWAKEVKMDEIPDELASLQKAKEDAQAEKVAKQLENLEVQRQAAKVQHGGLSYDELKLQVEAAQRGITGDNVDQPLAVIQGIEAMGDKTKAVSDFLFSKYAEEAIKKGPDALEPAAKLLVDELAHKNPEIYTDILAAHYGIEKSIEIEAPLTPVEPSIAPVEPSVAPIGPSVEPIGPSVAPIGPSVAPVAPFKSNRLELLKTGNLYEVQSLYYEALADAIEQKQIAYMEANGGKAEVNLQDYHLVCEKMVDQLDKQAEALNILKEIQLKDPARFKKVIEHNEELAKIPGYKAQIARLEAEKAGLQKALATDSTIIRENAVDKAIASAERIMDRCKDPEKIKKYEKQIKELKSKKVDLHKERELNESNRGKIEKDIAGLEENIARVTRDITRIENTNVPDVFMAGGKSYKASELTATIATAETEIEKLAKQGQFRAMEKAVSSGKFMTSGGIEVRESTRKALTDRSVKEAAKIAGVKTSVRSPFDR